MKWIEVDSKTLQTLDIESNAIIFHANKDEYQSLNEFGHICTSIKEYDYDNELLIEPFYNKEYRPTEISESEFWERCTITQYLECNIGIEQANITKVMRFWDEWNNSFNAIELSSGDFCGVFWWTTA
ncbi:MAG: hypothetical protein FWC89_00315 [Defluviitaleaceae bacterium]|nr:hypothetical protein [Defluviitaleaceae bacterium]